MVVLAQLVDRLRAEDGRLRGLAGRMEVRPPLLDR
jgi:hypothetical protein